MRLRIVLAVLASLVALGGCDKLKGGSSGGAAPSASASAAAPATTAAGGGAAVPGAVKTACDLKATDFAEKNHVENGKAILVTCPGGCNDGSVWGTDLYTDDSTVCRAMIHAGAIPANGGTAAITFANGQLTYVGSEKNGVASSDYGKWTRSFYVQAIDDKGKPKGAPPAILGDTTALVKCAQPSPFEGAAGASFTAICTSDCTEGSVWGSNPYTSDSSLCAAAHHAGLIKPGALKVKVTLGGPQPSFKGTTANGVTSNAYGKYETSLTLSKAE